MKTELIKKLLLLILLGTLLSACAASPATYYVDSAIGNDDASGTSMDSSGSKGPLRTLAKVSTLKLLPGDQVLLKCGQTFDGPLRIKTTNKGGEGSLKLGAYGNCNAATLPIISGLRRLRAGESRPSGLTQWKVPGPIGMVVVDGQYLPPARHPAKGYHIWSEEGEQPDGAAALKSLLPGKELGGAKVWLRSQDWLLEERRISAQGSHHRLDKKFEYPIRKGVGIYLTGKPWMIGDSPAWAYDEDSQKLTVRLPRGAKNVSIAADEPLVEIKGDSSVSISQWRLASAGGTALFIHADAFVQVKDSVIERVGRNGMHIIGSTYAVIENNTITETGTDGIFFAEARRVFVKGNTLRRIGLWGPPKTALAAINAHRTSRAVIDNNLVDGSAYIGIRFSGDAQVRRNVVLQTCQVLSDCGAIYTWRRDVNHVAPASDISHNTIIGVNGDTSVRYSMVDFFSGIYLDDFTRDVDVLDNVVVDAAQGIYVHNAVRNKVVGNHVLGTRNEAWQILLGIDRPRFPANESLYNEVRDNELTPRFPKYRLPSDLTARSEQVSLVDAGNRKIAISWANWKTVNWGKVSPGCTPSGSRMSRLPGDAEDQPTAIVLDCAPFKP